MLLRWRVFGSGRPRDQALRYERSQEEVRPSRVARSPRKIATIVCTEEPHLGDSLPQFPDIPASRGIRGFESLSYVISLARA